MKHDHCGYDGMDFGDDDFSAMVGILFFLFILFLLSSIVIKITLSGNNAVMNEFTAARAVAPAQFEKPPTPPQKVKARFYKVEATESCENDKGYDRILAENPQEAARMYVKKYWPWGFETESGPHHLTINGKVIEVTVHHEITLESKYVKTIEHPLSNGCLASNSKKGNK